MTLTSPSHHFWPSHHPHLSLSPHSLAPQGETFQTAIARHEYYLAGRLGVKQGDKVLDVGCGIGGPLRNIARFTRADITGVTLNEYQVMRGNELTKKAGLAATARLVQQDFMKLNDFKVRSLSPRCLIAHP